MVKYYSDHKKYLDLPNEPSKNQNIEEAKQLFLNNFDDALVTETISVDEIEFEVMLKHEKKGENKKAIFKPNTRIDIGSIIKFKDNVFLTVDFLGDGIYEVYPTATLKICNSTFPIESDKTKVLFLTDENGEMILDDFDDPIPIESEKEIIQVPCIVETSYTSRYENVQLPLPDGTIKVTIQNQKASNLKLNEEFVMYGVERYKIVHFDRTKVINEKGLLTITADRVVNK